MKDGSNADHSRWPDHCRGIGLVFSLGWALATASDRYTSRWVQRLFGILIVISRWAASFWIVFIRSGVLSWDDLAHLLPPH
jgi:hypothetical protein